MSIQLTNKYGVLDVSVIDARDVAALNDDQQRALASLVSAIETREAASERVRKAVIAVNAATAEQTAALAAHHEASQPFAFVVPKEIEEIADPDRRASAMQAARWQHDLRVTEHRQAEARAASIAAYNKSH